MFADTISSDACLDIARSDERTTESELPFYFLEQKSAKRNKINRTYAKNCIHDYPPLSEDE